VSPATDSRSELHVLVVDVGGSHVKIRATGPTEDRRFESGPEMTPKNMTGGVLELAADWEYEVVSVGFPGPVVRGRIIAEPCHLGSGWVGFDFQAAFSRPVKLINDAAMQAAGSYRGGKMLFLGLGTGLGTALILDGRIEPLELGHLPYRKGKTFEDYVGARGLKRLGRKRWQRHVERTISRLRAALLPDYVVLGGGNASRLDPVPDDVIIGSNERAFEGGERLWNDPVFGSAGQCGSAGQYGSAGSDDAPGA
jgi:polyphosphate glucokinase